MEPLTLTVIQASKLSQIGRNSILADIHAKELEAIRIGSRKILIPRKSLESYLEKKTSEGIV